MPIEIRDAVPADCTTIAEFNSRLSAETVAGIRLYVEQDNKRAQATYDRLGMSKTSYEVMQTLFAET